MLTYQLYTTIKVIDAEGYETLASDPLLMFVDTKGKDLIASFAGCDLITRCTIGTGGSTKNVFAGETTFTKQGFVVTASTAWFTSDYIGSYLYTQDNNSFEILKVISPTKAIVKNELPNYTNQIGGVIGSYNHRLEELYAFKTIDESTATTAVTKTNNGNLIIRSTRTYEFAITETVNISEIGSGPNSTTLFGYKRLTTPVTVNDTDTLIITFILICIKDNTVLISDPFFKQQYAPLLLNKIIDTRVGFNNFTGVGRRMRVSIQPDPLPLPAPQPIVSFLEPNEAGLNITFYDASDNVLFSYYKTSEYISGSCKRVWSIFTDNNNYLFNTVRIGFSNGESEDSISINYGTGVTKTYAHDRVVLITLDWKFDCCTVTEWFDGTESYYNYTFSEDEKHKQYAILGMCSDGTAYVNTGWSPSSNNVTIELCAQFGDAETPNTLKWMGVTSNGTNSLMMGIDENGVNPYKEAYAVGSEYVYTNTRSSTKYCKRLLNAAEGTYSIDNKQVATFTPPTNLAAINGNFTLFAVYDSFNENYYTEAGNVIVYSLKIIEDNVIVRNMLPVRIGSVKYSNIPAPSNCFWDTVTSSYYEAIGGTLTAVDRGRYAGLNAPTLTPFKIFEIPLIEQNALTVDDRYIYYGRAGSIYRTDKCGNFGTVIKTGVGDVRSMCTDGSYFYLGLSTGAIDKYTLTWVFVETVVTLGNIPACMNYSNYNHSIWASAAIATSLYCIDISNKTYKQLSCYVDYAKGIHAFDNTMVYINSNTNTLIGLPLDNAYTSGVNRWSIPIISDVRNMVWDTNEQCFWLLVSDNKIYRWDVVVLTENLGYAPPKFEFGDLAIVSNGWEWINTGVRPTDQMDWQFEFENITTISTQNFGAHGASGPATPATRAYILINYDEENETKHLMAWGVNPYSFMTLEPHRRHRIDKKGNTLNVDNKHYRDATGGISNITTNLCLFGRLHNAITSPDTTTVSKIYGFTIWSDSTRTTKLLEFKPVNTGSTLYSTTPAPSNCFWNTVTQTYFQNNATTGRFGYVDESLAPTKIKNAGYLYCDGSADINLGAFGFISSLMPHYVIDLEFQSLSGSYPICGGAQTSTSSRFYLYRMETSDLLSFGYNSTLVSSSTHCKKVTLGKRYTIEFCCGRQIVNGTMVPKSSVCFSRASPVNTSNLYLCNATGTTTQGFIGRIYGFKLWQYHGGPLLRNLIPVPAGDTTYSSVPAPSDCFWDDVSSQYMQNAGTGSFKYMTIPEEVEVLPPDENPIY